MPDLATQCACSPVTVYATAYPRGVVVDRQQFTALDRHIGTNLCTLPWAYLFKQTLLPQALQEALASTLDTFPTLSGRVKPLKRHHKPCTSHWELLCCNKGVPCSTHTSSWSCQKVIDNGCLQKRQGFRFPAKPADPLPAYMEPLDPTAVLRGNAPVVAVRLTQLAAGGSILAITASHVVLDGRSYTQFLRHWAACYNACIGIAKVPRPVTGPSSNTEAAQPQASVSSEAVLVRPYQRSKQLLKDLASQAADHGNSKQADDAKLTAQQTRASPCNSVTGHIPANKATAGSTAAGHGASGCIQGASDCNDHFPYSPDPLYATRVLDPGWGLALKMVWAAISQLRSEKQHSQNAISQTKQLVSNRQSDAAAVRASPNPNILATELLHIPENSLKELKAVGSMHCTPGQYISTNDAVSSLVWLLMCYLRKRPLPGQLRPAHLQDSCLGLALDLRTAPAEAIAAGAAASAPTIATAVPGASSAAVAGSSVAAAACSDSTANAVPINHFGSAAWSVHVRSCNEKGEPGVQAAWQLTNTPWHKHTSLQAWQQLGNNAPLLQQSLAAGAVRIRGALQAVRRDKWFTGKMLQQVDESVDAPTSSQLALGASLVHRLDAFVTSWQFAIWDVKFGDQVAAAFQGLVHPVPPYHAVIMPAAGGNDGADTGLWLWLTVPSCLISTMKSAPLLQLLVPSAEWVASSSHAVLGN